MLKKIIAVFSLAAAFAVSGCASHTTLSDLNRAQTKTVHIKDTVTMPADMFYQDRSMSMAMGVLGPLGAVVVNGKDSKHQLLDAMEQNNILLPVILRAEFTRSLRSKTNFVVVDDKTPADADVVLAVNMYGLGQTQGFGSLLYPVMNVRGKMIKSDGSVIWSYADYVTPHNDRNTGGHEFDEYIKTPSLLGDTFSNASGIVSDMLVADLVEKK